MNQQRSQQLLIAASGGPHRRIDDAPSADTANSDTAPGGVHDTGIRRRMRRNRSQHPDSMPFARRESHNQTITAAPHPTSGDLPLFRARSGDCPCWQNPSVCCVCVSLGEGRCWDGRVLCRSEF